MVLVVIGRQFQKRRGIDVAQLKKKIGTMRKG
jgi:hypothetical protein